ncbi:tRNA (N6-threonylcarbamoyladenosine(37)-N6)-methyltransferase TrmO [Terasakiispira papahanaumokuakeensis]|uniref:tRNA (N6-threonylcarbamoyladenosine(37)-N6)-methyltransferase TrmO n=1 Tax=Terasakiispira papahanaumokuakeensis TaxID=197479 RepID=A0A1E2VAG3_9GAMM|nr:tRNA (N6-threonylcarbamoyladenosine(37)-N6)-methyltransferase TrmO [Terasakiispira papahanaumokuakeensis]ODC04009.1 tRNA (N6-threonylcarbamoyladenosine(37)-N6)-methyltransferase TrmO [Terasakiispira papahanaumokuakeensis]
MPKDERLTHTLDGPYSVTPIAMVTSDFEEKFAVPRQPGLAPSARARLVLIPPFDRPEALKGLDQHSHLWLIFRFHLAQRSTPTSSEDIAEANPDSTFKPTVRPPRLGGNQKLGVFASRSPFRPNSMGLSVVKLEAVHADDPNGPWIEISGADLVDGTPILDIKPYIPYADSLSEAHSEWAATAPIQRPVSFSPEALATTAQHQEPERLKAVIEEVLSQDPRPAYQQQHPDVDRIYGVRLMGVNVRFRCLSDDTQPAPHATRFEVIELKP